MSKPIITLDASSDTSPKTRKAKATRKVAARRAANSLPMGKAEAMAHRKAKAHRPTIRHTPSQHVLGWFSTPHYDAWHWEGDSLWCTRGDWSRQVGFTYKAEARSSRSDIVHEVYSVRGCYLIVEHSNRGRRVVAKSQYARKAYKAAAYRQASASKAGDTVEVWRARDLEIPAHIQHQ